MHFPNLRWLKILAQIGPVAVSFIPGVGPLLAPIIIHAIDEAEKIKGSGTGIEKKQHALETVTTIAAGINAASGKELIDPASLTDVSSKAIDTVVGIVNLTHKSDA